MADDDPARFPIPRVRTIGNARPPLQPQYDSEIPPFNLDLFQQFYSLVAVDLPAYDLGSRAQLSPALATVSKALEPEAPPSVMLDQLVRKFLLNCQSQFLQLSANPAITKIAQLHHELYTLSELIREKNIKPELTQYADMLTGEVYDLYDSEFAKRVNADYWGAGKSGEAVIAELLTKEIERVRLLNQHTGSILAVCAVQRSLDKADVNGGQAILNWAKQNGIEAVYQSPD
jgi:hypothetical protein